MNSTKKKKNKSTDIEKDIIHKTINDNNFSDIIISIASSNYYVHKDSRVENIANNIQKIPELLSFAIVDDHKKVLGIVSRKDFFYKLGIRYGRDILFYKEISELAVDCTKFKAKKNIYSIAEKTNENLSKNETVYYCLINDDQTYAGIVSTRDIRIYLSRISQIDLALATKIQENIVKDNTIIENNNFAALGSSKMARGVGGDFYKIYNYSLNKWFFTICDVSGKGLSASLVTGIIGGMIASFDFSRGIDKFILTLNNYILKTFNLEKFITGLFLNFDEKTGKIKLFDMGHSMGIAYLYIYRDEKLFKLKLKPFNAPIGLIENLTTHDTKFKLKKGDRLLLITDGVVDQRNIHDQGYPIKRIEKIFKKNKNLNLTGLKKEIQKDIKKFLDEMPMIDDITFMIVDYKS